MSLSKLTPRSLCEKISRLTSTIINNYMLHGHVPQNYRLVDMIGMMLYCLALLVVTAMLMVATCISSLWFVMILTWQKLTELLQSTERQELQARFTSWLSAGQQKVTSLTEKVSQNLHSKKATATAQDSTSTYSATPGVPSPVNEKGYPSYEAVNNLNETLEERARKAGL